MYREGLWLMQLMVAAKSCVHSLKIRCCVLTDKHTLMRVWMITNFFDEFYDEVFDDFF